ncbi:MAG TPA: GNAT family N-acetyltransferase [Fimbriimonadaceae bacterium]|jgi:predicted acetyltransferase
MNCELVTPSEKYKDSFLEAEVERANEPNNAFGDRVRPNKSFEEVLADIRRAAQVEPFEGKSIEFWLVDGDEYIGSFDISPATSKIMADKFFSGWEGGNIGFYIRPTKRGQGYGTSGFALALEKSKGFGLKRALVITERSRPGAMKIAENNRGILIADNHNVTYRFEFE